MSYQVYIVEAFTDDKVKTLGNPAGVVLTDGSLSAGEMASIARQAGVPMTAFLEPLDSGMTDYNLRYYDPTGRECHICGHATVAASAQLAQLFPQLDGQELSFHLNPDQFGGQERVLKTRVDGAHVGIDLFASTLRHENDPQLTALVSGLLGIREEDIDSIAFSTDVRDYVVGLKDPDILLAMAPDFEGLREMAEAGPYQHEGMMVSAPAKPGGDYDLYVRVFLPITGVDEDIACGSSNCSNIPYWHQKGLNNNSDTFRTLFPFPSGPAGTVGGVQHVTYDKAQEVVTIVSQARLAGVMTVEARPQIQPQKKSSGLEM